MFVCFVVIIIIIIRVVIGIVDVDVVSILVISAAAAAIVVVAIVRYVYQFSIDGTDDKCHLHLDHQPDSLFVCHFKRMYFESHSEMKRNKIEIDRAK